MTMNLTKLVRAKIDTGTICLSRKSRDLRSAGKVRRNHRIATPQRGFPPLPVQRAQSLFFNRAEQDVSAPATVTATRACERSIGGKRKRRRHSGSLTYIVDRESAHSECLDDVLERPSTANQPKRAEAFLTIGQVSVIFVLQFQTIRVFPQLHNPRVRALSDH